MKFRLFKNDKSTIKDELQLLFFIVLCFIIGLFLILRAPAIWILKASMTKTFGVLCIMVAEMLTPGLIYRIMTNDK